MRQIIVISIVRVLAIFCQLGYIRLYTAHLTKYDLGIYFFLAAISYFLNALVFIPLDYYQQSRIYRFLEKNISLRIFLKFNRTVFLLIGALVGVAAVIAFFIKREIAFYLVIVVLMAFAFYAVTTLKSALNNLEYKRIAAVIFLAEALFKIGFFYLAIQFIRPGAVTLFVSNIVALCCVVIILAFIYRFLGVFRSGEIKKLDYNEMFRFAYPISLSAVIYWLQMQGYRIFFVPLGFVETVGIYATLSQIGIAGMNAISTIYGQIFTPNVYKTAGQYTKVYIRNALLIIAGILVGGYIFSDLIVSVATKGDFVNYSKVILFGIANESINMIVAVLAIFFTIKSITGAIMKGTIIGAVVMVVILGVVYLSKAITVYTIGLPIILSQMVVLSYMYIAYRKVYIADYCK